MTTVPDPDRPDPTEPDLPVEQRLERLLLEAEESLRALHEELAAQRTHLRQHQEIERLPEHLARTSSKWAGIRVFLDELVADFRRLRGAEPGEDAAGRRDEDA
ncbi:hypothetical protein [Brachybacterium saurashtrense]|uniref:DUF2203 family protein n=1 Tax=Brachybacterium saurashtrense TaxID=556288 RepID=A0A345YPW5_9MICO|nr:hypothetical protein [Brachybacterium saurashtrense]AXK45967.1 hypothetical protein DWV08_10355 [Brachybacterium saurashtrense]RRR23706.1 hypothetical protein DXU92_02105 [Brachybacterium saurashtrense]